MRCRIRILSFVGLLLALAFGGCEATYSGPYRGFPASEPDMTFGPGDVFDVRVYHEKDMSESYRVGADGTIDFPLIGEIKVAGKSPRTVAQELREKLSGGYIKNPQVSVYPKE